MINSNSSSTTSGSAENSPTINTTGIETNVATVESVVEVIIVNTGRTEIVNNQEEWKKLLSENKYLIILDSDNKTVKYFGQSNKNYLVLQSDFDDNLQDEMQVQLQQEGFKVFSRYVEQCYKTCEHSIQYLQKKIEDMEGKNFIDQFQNFTIESTFDVDFHKMSDEMQQKLNSFCKKMKSTKSDLVDLLTEGVKQSLQDLTSNDEKIKYFNQTLQNFKKLQSAHRNPFGKMMDELYLELKMFGDFKNHYESVVNEFSRRNNEELKIKQLQEQLSQLYKAEQQKRAESTNTIGSNVMNFVVKKIPKVQTYRVEQVEMFSPTELVSSSGVFDSQQSTTTASGASTTTTEEDGTTDSQNNDEHLTAVEIEKLKKETDGLNDIITKLVEEKSLLQGSENTLKSETEKLNEIIRKKNEEYQSIQEGNEKLKKQIELLNESIRKQHDEQILLQSSEETLKKENEKLNETIRKYKEDNELLKQIEKSLKSQNESIEKDIENQNKNVQDLTRQIQECNNQLTLFKNKNSCLDQNLEQIKREKEENVYLLKRISFLEGENCILTEKENNYRIQLEEQVKKNQDLEKKVTESNAQMNSYKQKCESLSTSILQKDSHINHLNQKIDDMDLEFGRERGTFTTINQQHNEVVLLLKDGLSKKITELESTKETVTSLRLQLDGSSERNTTLQKMLDQSEQDASQKIYLLNTEISTLGHKLEKSNQDYGEILTSVVLLNEELSLLRTNVGNQLSTPNDRQVLVLRRIVKQVYDVCKSLANVIKDQWLDETVALLESVIPLGDDTDVVEETFQGLVVRIRNRLNYAIERKLIEVDSDNIRPINSNVGSSTSL